MYGFFEVREIFTATVNWNEDNPTKRGGEKCDTI